MLKEEGIGDARESSSYKVHHTKSILRNLILILKLVGGNCRISDSGK